LHIKRENQLIGQIERIDGENEEQIRLRKSILIRVETKDVQNHVSDVFGLGRITVRPLPQVVLTYERVVY
jgi:hypothetical protein